MSPPAVTVIVVSFRSRTELPDCLSSIAVQSGVAADTWVVDNASDDGSAALVAARFPATHLVANRDNVGFAAANNQVLANLATPYVALVNPDAVLPPTALATCVAYLEQHADVGAVATRLVHADGSHHPSCFGFLTLVNLFGETVGLDLLFPDSPLGSYRRRRHDRTRVVEADWIQGAFFVTRARVCREVGIFDPDYFMYGEEMDWCYRMRAAGWRVVRLPEPPVVHIGGVSSGTMPGPLFVELLKSRVRFLAKHRGAAATFVGRGLIAISVLIRATWWGGRRLFDRGPLTEQRVTMFAAALRWVAAGLPLSPPPFLAPRTPS